MIEESNIIYALGFNYMNKKLKNEEKGFSGLIRHISHPPKTYRELIMPGQY
jgi:hypothetical protein